MSKVIVAGPGMMITPRYLRPRQAAAYASVSLRAIARAIAEGLLISYLVPGRGKRMRVRLIDREDLERFIEGRSRADGPTERPAEDSGRNGGETTGGERSPAPRAGSTGSRRQKEAGR